MQSEKESIMKCPNCGKEMRDGYLFAAKMVHSVSQMKFRECLRMQKCGWICEDYRVKAESQNTY